MFFRGIGNLSGPCYCLGKKYMLVKKQVSGLGIIVCKLRKSWVCCMKTGNIKIEMSVPFFDDSAEIGLSQPHPLSINILFRCKIFNFFLKKVSGISRIFSTPREVRASESCSGVGWWLKRRNNFLFWFSIEIFIVPIKHSPDK